MHALTYVCMSETGRERSCQAYHTIPTAGKSPFPGCLLGPLLRQRTAASILVLAFKSPDRTRTSRRRQRLLQLEQRKPPPPSVIAGNGKSSKKLTRRTTTTTVLHQGGISIAFRQAQPEPASGWYRNRPATATSSPLERHHDDPDRSPTFPWRSFQI